MSEALSKQARGDTASSRLPDRAVIEQAISTIGGVRGAHVIIEPGHGITELHVLASPSRAPKKIIRDIESLLLVQYGCRIDYRSISLAQVAEPGGTTASRVVLGRVDRVQTPQGDFIDVELRNGRDTHHGRYALTGDAAHTTAMATVAAINSVCAPAAPIELGGVQCSTMGRRQVITAYIVRNGTEHLLGTAFVHSTVSAATARAVLAATNRRLIDGL